MDETFELTLDIQGLPAAEVNKALTELGRVAEEAGATARKDKNNTATQMDADTLVLLFNTGAAIAIARGIQVLLAKASSTLEIEKSAGGSIRLKARGDGVARAAAALGVLDAEGVKKAAAKKTSKKK